jgi:hypothetical protein
MRIALSITVEKKSDGRFDPVSPSLLNGKPTTYSFCSTEAIGEQYERDFTLQRVNGVEMLGVVCWFRVKWRADVRC